GHGEAEVTSLAEVHQGAGHPVGAESRVAIDERDRAPRLALEEEPRADDGVAAEVIEASAADRRLVPDVARVRVEEGEEDLDGAERPDPSLADQLAGPQPLRVEADHEGFHHFHARGHGLDPARFFIAGITFSTPIRAVLSTPQTTFFMRHPREWRSPDLSRPRRPREMRPRPEGHGRARTG